MRIKISRFPPRPTEDEQTCYYKGIGDCPPRLIARTSKSVWPPSSSDDCEAPDKWIDCVADEELIDKWTVHLETTLRQTLRTCDWAFFVPLRIRDNHDSLKTEEENTGEVVLIVGLWEHMEWREAVSYARLCRAHMYSQGINIHVEMVYVGNGAKGPYDIDAGLERLGLQSGMANARSILDELYDCHAEVGLHKSRGLLVKEKTCLSQSFDGLANEIHAVFRLETSGTWDVCGRTEVVMMMHRQ